MDITPGVTRQSAVPEVYRSFSYGRQMMSRGEFDQGLPMPV
jgi:hypothetical protein